MKQYTRMFRMEGVKLTFTQDALRAIARKAIKHGTGARGLRAICEGVLLDTMYDLPSAKGVREVVVDADCVEGDARPHMVLDDPASLPAQGASAKKPGAGETTVMPIVTPASGDARA